MNELLFITLNKNKLWLLQINLIIYTMNYSFP